MKLTSELLGISEATAQSNKQISDLLRFHKLAKKVSAEKSVVQHINKNVHTGQLYVSDWFDDDETVATYNNGKQTFGKEVNEGIGADLAARVMGAAPKEPKYKVGQVVDWEMDPPQKNGKGQGKITAYKNGFYMINGNRPVNHFEIKKVVKEAKAQGLWKKLNALAEKNHGEFGFSTLDETDMAKYIDLKKANKLAMDLHGEFGFATLDEEDMEKLINDNPHLVKALKESVTEIVDSLLAEGKISSFEPPFKSDGRNVRDATGRAVDGPGVDRQSLNDIAKALNDYVGVKEAIDASKLKGWAWKIDPEIVKAKLKSIISQTKWFNVDEKGTVKMWSDDYAAFYSTDWSVLQLTDSSGQANYFKVKDKWYDLAADSIKGYSVSQLSEILSTKYPKAKWVIKNPKPRAMTLAVIKEGQEEPLTADKLDIGDTVVISGDVEYQDRVGEISSFGTDKKFVVVNLHGGIGNRSFHSSDVTQEMSDHDQEDDDDQDDESDDTRDESEWDSFYVAFYEEDERKSWIGCVTKAEGGKWHEEPHSGEPDYRWGTSYMSYLTPEEVMSWIKTDYRRGYEVEGPFETAEEAEEHAHQNWGHTLEESVDNSKSTLANLEKFAGQKIKAGRNTIKGFPVDIEDGGDEAYIEYVSVDKDTGTGLMKALRAAGFKVKRFDDNNFTVSTGSLHEAESFTDFNDWKQAVLNSYPTKAKQIKFKGRMEGNKDTISAEVPGEDRSYGVWDQDEEKGVVLSEGMLDDIKAVAKKFGKWLIEPVYGDEHFTDIVNYETLLKKMQEDEMWVRIMATLSNEQLEKAVVLKNPKTPQIKIAAKAELEKRNVKGVVTEGVGKYSPTVKKTFVAAKTVKGIEYDQEGYDQYGYNELGKDRDNKSEYDYIEAHIQSMQNEGVVDKILGGIKHQKNMAKANAKGWGKFGDTMRMGFEYRDAKTPEEKAELHKKATKNVRDGNRYRDFADGGKGFNSGRKTTRELKNDETKDKIVSAVKGAAKSIKDKFAVKEGFSPYKLNAKVKIIGGPKDVIGKIGSIGEIKTEAGKKTFIVDYDHDEKSGKPNFGMKSISLLSTQIKLVKDTPVKEAKNEQLKVVKKGNPEKVLFTGTLDECKDFMRSHKSLKMDLLYANGQMASFVL